MATPTRLQPRAICCCCNRGTVGPQSATAPTAAALTGAPTRQPINLCCSRALLRWRVARVATSLSLLQRQPDRQPVHSCYFSSWLLCTVTPAACASLHSCTCVARPPCATPREFWRENGTLSRQNNNNQSQSTKWATWHQQPIIEHENGRTAILTNHRYPHQRPSQNGIIF